LSCNAASWIALCDSCHRVPKDTGLKAPQGNCKCETYRKQEQQLFVLVGFVAAPAASTTQAKEGMHWSMVCWSRLCIVIACALHHQGMCHACISLERSLRFLGCRRISRCTQLRAAVNRTPVLYLWSQATAALPRHWFLQAEYEANAACSS
jgi:hypothetical protein